MQRITSEYADYDEVIEKFDWWMDWLADIYVNVLNLIHYMHDKYYYEAAEMALINNDCERSFATGIAGFSHVVDSLSAIKYAKVKIIRDEEGITKDFEIEGDFPRYGNDDPRADEIATWLLRTFFDKIRRRHTYRDSKPSTSILTITSNVVYGEATGATPDGRKAYTSFAPGTLLQSLTMRMHWMEFPIPRPLIRRHLDMKQRNARITWFRFLTDILHRMPII